MKQNSKNELKKIPFEETDKRVYRIILEKPDKTAFTRHEFPHHLNTDFSQIEILRIMRVLSIRNREIYNKLKSIIECADEMTETKTDFKRDFPRRNFENGTH